MYAVYMFCITRTRHCRIIDHCTQTYIVYIHMYAVYTFYVTHTRHCRIISHSIMSSREKVVPRRLVKIHCIHPHTHTHGHTQFYITYMVRFKCIYIRTYVVHTCVYHTYVFSLKTRYRVAETDIHKETDIHVCMILMYVSTVSSGYRVAETHRIPYLYRSFSAKEPYI